MTKARWPISNELIARARAGDKDAFSDLVDPHQSELRAHCYRMLGSVHDAEDAVQETMLAAWVGFAGFESRASVRTWLYRIATSRCLNALRSAGRRQDRSWTPPAVEPPEPTQFAEVTWLDPYPDILLDNLAGAEKGPEAQVEAREAISLAFVTALQLLPQLQVGTTSLPPKRREAEVPTTWVTRPTLRSAAYWPDCPVAIGCGCGGGTGHQACREATWPDPRTYQLHRPAHSGF